MTQRFASAALTLLVIGVMSSCILDPDPKPPTPGPPPVTAKFENLSEKWHVLNNLELSYNERDIVHYTEILDSLEFIFFFSEGDVGGNIPAAKLRELSEAIEAAFVGVDRIAHIVRNIKLFSRTRDMSCDCAPRCIISNT